MRPACQATGFGQWLVFPSMLDGREGIRPTKTYATYPQTFSSRTSGGRRLRGTGSSSFTWKTAIKTD